MGMREIKFRVWVPETKWMLYPDKDYQHLGLVAPPFIIFPNGSLKTGNQFWSEDAKLMQFTGLKDMYSVDIYESDIAKNSKTQEVFEIFYDDDLASFSGIDRTVGVVAGLKCGPTLFPLRGEIEIIGNIYENPELLKTNQGEK
jgi:YopX protein